jgi:5-methylcytosine-specific restriction endonuclease McrA
MTSQVLITDSGGNPKNWVNHETAVCYYARSKVLWEVGDKIRVYHGGRNEDGEQSIVEISSILGVTGPLLGEKFFARESIYTDRKILYARDRYLCAYCGDEHGEYKLTIDHVMPKSRGGKNIWANCVTACKPCNHRKADRTPEEAHMKLLYVPYAPNMFEKMILKNRNILADQMDFLKARVPKHSRVFL